MEKKINVSLSWLGFSLSKLMSIKISAKIVKFITAFTMSNRNDDELYGEYERLFVSGDQASENDKEVGNQEFEESNDNQDNGNYIDFMNLCGLPRKSLRPHVPIFSASLHSDVYFFLYFKL